MTMLGDCCYTELAPPLCRYTYGTPMQLWAVCEAFHPSAEEES